MKLKKIFYVIGLLLTLPLISPQTMANEWAKANQKIAEEFAIPRYQTLYEASSKLVKQTNSFCKNVDEKSLKSTRKTFLETMDAWQQVQLFRLGPAELFMRHFRFEMWPDRSNTGAKQIAKLLSKKNLDALNPKTFSRASTAVQGIPAMERLLFSKGISSQQFLTDKNANYRCQLLKAISVNIQTMSQNLLKDWQGKHLKDITTPSEENDYFETHKEVSSQFLKELATQLQAITDQKLKRPMDGKRFRPKRAESWRSGHSLHNIVENLKSTEQLFQIGFAPLLSSNLLSSKELSNTEPSDKAPNEALRKKLNKQFKQAIETGNRLDMPLNEAYLEHRALLDEWKMQISTLKKMVTQELPKALGIPLGFNSLDGD